MRSSLFLPLLAALAAAVPVADQLTFTSPDGAPASAFSLPSLSSLNLPAPHLASLASHIASLPEKRLVSLAEDAEPIELTEGEKALLVFAGKRFVDVTDEEVFFRTQAKEAFPTKLSYSTSLLEPLFAHVCVTRMKVFLAQFSKFYTRYYRSSTGKESQAFLLAHIREIASTNKKVNITISEFEHSWGQNSIIARFEPSVAPKTGRWRMADELALEKIVIIGAHQDSTNLLPFLAAPGADDDGSGTTTSIAAFTSLVNASFVPSTNPVEFHFYSAEEGGLLGSQAVAQEYARKGTVVRAMLQMDMTAWVKAGTKPTFGVITDFVDPEFTQFIRQLIEAYAEIGWTDTKCGYACSDHASWTKIGVPSSFTIESTFENSNHNIHSTNDRIDYSPEFSFEHMAQFARLAISLAVELGGGESLVRKLE